MTLQEIFAGCTAKPLLAEEPMAKHTSFRIGGPADLMAMPQSEQELQQLLQRAGESKVPVTLIGNGSNLLVRDKGIRGLVIKLGNMLNDVVADGCTLTFGSGVSLAAASRKAAELGLSGMEFAVGIPGSIGGAVYMNAGAYDGEMAKVVTGVRVMELDGTISELAAAALDFGYRHTALQGSGKIVTAVTVRLTAGDKQAIADKMADFSNRRITKQPLELPSAGSMFKRPPGYFAGTLIDQTGLKGYTVGGAQVDTFGVGERLITSKSNPVFGGVYKLAAIEDDEGNIIPKIKVSENTAKITNPHFKRLYRLYDRESGKAIADELTLRDEVIDPTKPHVIFDPNATWKTKELTDFTVRELQVPIFQNGELVYELPELNDIKAYCRQQIHTLWDEVKRFENPHTYYVDLSQKLWDVKRGLLEAAKC